MTPGRPELVWTGKRPPAAIAPPAVSHVETCDPAGALAKAPAQPELWRGWPAAHPAGGVLVHGDQRLALAPRLASACEVQVDLVYIDPPFDSGADYVRKVVLRGPQPGVARGGGASSLGAQVQYSDVWGSDEYLQFMYERLVLHH